MRQLAQQHLVEHTPQRVEVRAGSDRLLSARLFRAHVERGAEAEAGLGEPGTSVGTLHGQGDPEVHQEGLPVVEEH